MPDRAMTRPEIINAIEDHIVVLNDSDVGLEDLPNVILHELLNAFQHARQHVDRIAVADALNVADAPTYDDVRMLPQFCDTGEIPVVHTAESLGQLSTPSVVKRMGPH